MPWFSPGDLVQYQPGDIFSFYAGSDTDNGKIGVVVQTCDGPPWGCQVFWSTGVLRWETVGSLTSIKNMEET